MKKIISLALALLLCLVPCAYANESEAPAADFPYVGTWTDERQIVYLRIEEGGLIHVDGVVTTYIDNTVTAVDIMRLPNVITWHISDGKLIYDETVEFTPCEKDGEYCLVGEAITYYRVGDWDCEVPAKRTPKKDTEQSSVEALDFPEILYGKWSNVFGDDSFVLNEDGTGTHDEIKCRYTIDDEKQTVNIIEGVASIRGTDYTFQKIGSRSMLIPDGKDIYYVRTEEYDEISEALRGEITTLLTTTEFWKSTIGINYLQFNEYGGGWFLIQNLTAGMSWEFVSNTTIKLHVDYNGGQTITLNVVNENGNKKLVNASTGQTAYIPKG